MKTGMAIKIAKATAIGATTMWDPWDAGCVPCNFGKPGDQGVDQGGCRSVWSLSIFVTVIFSQVRVGQIQSLSKFSIVALAPGPQGKLGMGKVSWVRSGLWEWMQEESE